MRKKIFGAIAVVAIAGAIALNVNLKTQTEDTSQLTLSNIEALAQTEGRTDCYGPKMDGVCLFENGIHCVSESYGCL
jgi:enamine deaminase RidA (YjgF/YER057c/UK114 family)